MERYLMDTNVVSDYFSASFSKKATVFMDNVIDAVPSLSVISQIELLCWKIDPSTEKQVSGFIDDSVIFSIDNKVIEECVSLRRNKKIKTPDAIIAATALANNMTLLTRNEKDFAGVKNLKIINPHKI